MNTGRKFRRPIIGKSLKNIFNKEVKMKRLLLLALAAIPLFGASVHFIISDYDYDYYGEDYWYDEYWYDECWCDGHWVYYPHGYYCVHYVWWYPWWWDWYWHRCYWCSHFDWHFFYGGFYVVWYEGGCWWFRPRYGRWVRHRLPYAYHEIRYRAKQHGVYLPEKAPREISVPYKEKEIMKLAKEKDPELFARVEKEHKSGDLERMRKQYVADVNKEIVRKNKEYGIKDDKIYEKKSFDQKQHDAVAPKQFDNSDVKKQPKPYVREENETPKGITPHIKKQTKDKSTSSKKAYPDYDHYGDEEYEKRESKKATFERHENEEKNSSSPQLKKSSTKKIDTPPSDNKNKASEKSSPLKKKR
jgi:hypothetical protein